MGLRKLAHKIRRKLTPSRFRDSCDSIATADRNYPTPLFDASRSHFTSQANLLGPAPAPIVPYCSASIRRKPVNIDWYPEPRPLVVVNTPASEIRMVSVLEPESGNANPCDRLPELKFEGDFTESILESVPQSSPQSDASPLPSQSSSTLSAPPTRMSRAPSNVIGRRATPRDLHTGRNSTPVLIAQDPRSPSSFAPHTQLFDPFDPKRLEKEVIRLYRDKEFQAKIISELQRAAQAVESKAKQLQASKLPCGVN